MADPGEAARFNIRALLPGPDSGVRDALQWAGAPAGSVALLARHAAVEAVAVDGLRADEFRVLERLVGKGDGVLLGSPNGSRAVILGPLATVGGLPQALQEWGAATESLGAALADVLTGRLTPPPALPTAAGPIDPAARVLLIARSGDPDIAEADDAVAAPACRAVPGEAEARAALADGAALLRVDLPAAQMLWPLLATTQGGALLRVGGGMPVEEACAAVRAAIAAAAASGVGRERIWVEVDAQRRAGLGHASQLKSLGTALVADVSALAGSGAAGAAAIAVAHGADVVRCADAADVRGAVEMARTLLSD